MRRPRVSLTLPLIALILLILGLIANALLPSLTTPEQRADNVLLAAIPFILIFVGILLFYITLIALTANTLSDVIGPRLHQAVLRLIIAGILVGILAMFQPWTRALYTWGFVVLLISTLLYILWSHIRPARLPATEEVAA
ncbi:MAG: hypothetical protein K1X65_10780 [Caldilineales bacterium]|nr:hypothetical protein [Caldilineales bacterium]MCW5860428.1 hypothetical protein [Caldilineales bacterium]